jgi:hypothetical protein
VLRICFFLALLLFAPMGGPRLPPVEHEEDEPSSVEVGDILHIPIVPLA